MIYVYAIVDGSSDALANCMGVEDQPVRIERTSNLYAVMSDHEICPQPTAANVWRHENVVESLMKHWALLPARFGSCFRHLKLLAQVLEANQEMLLDALDRVRGCVELGVRVIWERPPAPPAITPSGGREYLLHRLEEEKKTEKSRRSAERLSDQIHEELRGAAKCGAVRLLDAAHLLCSAAYLVERGRLQEFRRQFENVQKNYRDLRMLCTGPWPPYNFSPKLQLSEVSCA